MVPIQMLVRVLVLVVSVQSCRCVSAGSSAMLLQCFAVRPDGPDGGALLQHCTTNRTRTRAIKPAIKHQTQKHLPCSSSSPKLPQPRTRPQRRRRAPRKIDEQQSATPPRPGPRRRQQRRASPVPNTEQQQGEEEEVLEEDTVDPTWTPPEAGESITNGSVFRFCVKMLNLV